MVNITRDKILEDSSKDLFWSKLTYLSPDKSKKSYVLFCASREYLEDNKILREDGKSNGSIDNWVNRVVDKWKVLENDIFNQQVHFDVYTNDPKAEVRGLTFLLKKNPHVTAFL